MKIFQKIISGWMAICLIISMLPQPAQAEETTAAEETLAVTEMETIPIEESTAPVEETTAPTEPGTEPPKETTHTSTEEETKPSEETTMPTEVVPDQTEEATEPIVEIELKSIIVHFLNSEGWPAVYANVLYDTGEWHRMELKENALNPNVFDLLVMDADGFFDCSFENEEEKTASITVEYTDDSLEFWFLDGELYNEEPEAWGEIRTEILIESEAMMESAETETSDPVEVTRAQWLQLLVETFGYTIEDDITLENYYPDLDTDAEYLNAVLIAVYYGLVDVLPNDNLYPDDAATREFAAYTLNACMGYISETTGEYSFNEVSEVSYPEDIQVSIERGWFELTEGDFCPDQAITLEEKAVMIADAEIYLADMAISGDYENQYTFKDGVIVIEEDVTMEVAAEVTRITIPNTDYDLSKGDTIVVFNGGLAIPYRVDSAPVSNGAIVVTATDLYFEDAIESMDVQTVTDTDPANFYTAENAELIFIEESTGQEYTQRQVLSMRASTAQSIFIPKFKLKSSVGDADLTISVELKNAKVCVDATVKNKKINTSVWLDSDVEATIKVSCPLNAFDGEGIEIPIGGYEVPGVGGINFSINIDVKGSVSLVKKYHMKVGAKVTLDAAKWKATTNSIYQITDKGSNINAEASAKAYLECKLGFYGKAMPIRGYVEGEMGFKANVKYTTYQQIEGWCVHFAAYLYGEVSAKLEWGMFGYEDSVSWTHEMIKEENSPIKISIHYEDGQQIHQCSRKELEGTSTGDPSKIGDKGYSTGSNSSYFGSGLGSSSSTSNSSTGESVVIYTYSLNEDNQATITGYNGSAISLTIPLKLDGYEVIAIGSNAFKNRTGIRTVVMQDNIRIIGDSAFAGCTNLRNLTLSENLNRIDDSAFKGCSSLTVVDIPDSVTEIGVASFFNCANLSYVHLSDQLVKINAQTFYGCSSLQRIVIPDSVTIIGSQAFRNCTKLASITLPKGLTTLGDSEWSGNLFGNCTALTEIAIPKTLIECVGYNHYPEYGFFYGCTNLKTIILEDGMTTVPAYLLQGSSIETITIPDSVTKIGAACFRSCQELKEIVIPDSVTVIGSLAFQNCTKLASITLPKGLTTLGDSEWSGNLFGNCTALTEIVIPKTLTECVGYNHYPEDGFFYGCTNLKTIILQDGMTTIPAYLLQGSSIETITIPDSVTKIGAACFRGCQELKEIVIPDSVTVIGSQAFSDTGFTDFTIPDTVLNIETAVFQDCANLQSIIWNKTIAKVPNNTFANCVDLKLINLPDSVTSLGDGVFNNCDALIDIMIPSHITTIGSKAFYDCDALTTIVIPNSTTSIGSNTFYDCDALTTVTIGNGVTSMGPSVFEHCDALKDVTLSRNLTSIPASSFKQCAELEEITIPYYTTSIGNNAFNSSPKLVKVTMPRGLASIGTTAFSYADKTVIYGVPGTFSETWATDNGFQFVAHEVMATTATLNKTELTLNKGTSEALQLSVTPADSTDAITWKSSNTSVATVTDMGVVAAVGNGTATIKVTAGKLSTSCKVTVVQPVTSISLNKTSLTMQALETDQLKATISPSNANDKAVSWSSSDSAIAAVDENGLVTALAKGTATITVAAQDGSGVARTCKVTVTNTAYVAQTPNQMESSHDYPDNCTDFWIYTLEGAENIAVTFDAKTEMEDGFDYLCIYDGTGKLVGKYTGTELARQTITIPGNTVKIQLETDDSDSAWGFKVTEIVRVGSLHNHEFSEWKQTKAPTCTEAGEKTRTCDCGEVEIIEIPALGHTEVISEAVDPDCTNTGLTEGKHCSVCSEVLIAQSTIPATGHSFGDWVVTIQPTYEAEGEEHWTCQNCDYYEVNVLPVLGTITDTGRTLSLSGVIFINQYIKAEGFEGVDIASNGGMLIWNAPIAEDEAVFGSEAVHVEGLIWNEKTEEYAQQTPGIPAKEYADELYIRIYIKDNDGNYVYGPLVEYSVQDYCEGRLEKSSNTKLKATCAELLHYGAAAQTYFGYSIDDLANANIADTWPQADWNADLLDAVVKANTSLVGTGTVTDNGKTLSLSGALLVNFYVKLDSAVSKPAVAEMYFWDGVEEELTLDNVSYKKDLIYSKGEYAAQSEMIAARSYGDTIYACAHFVDAEGNDHYSDVMAYSAEEYAAGRIEKSTNANLIATMKAMVIYGEAAQMYFG